MSSWLSDKLNKTFGLLSLSEAPDESVMWAHYGSSNSGFVIGFDSSHPFFSGGKWPAPQRVIYLDERPLWSMKSPLSLDARYFYTKQSKWSYEREWRVVAALSDSTDVRGSPDERYPIHLYSFPSDCVSQIILGSRASPATRDRLREVCLSHYAEVEVLEAKPSSRGDLINLVACKW